MKPTTRLVDSFRIASPLAAVFMAMLAGGCATAPAPSQIAETTKYTLENTDKFAALDETTHQAVSCTGIQHYTLADGRIEVIANLKNRSGRRLELQATCLFGDAHGLPVGAELVWQPITLTENTTQAVRFTAPNSVAKKYSIRVRQAR